MCRVWDASGVSEGFHASKCQGSAAMLSDKHSWGYTIGGLYRGLL